MRSLLVLPMWMIRPPSRRCRAASCVATNNPRTLMAISFSKSSSELLNGREDTGARVVHQNINGPECPDGFGNRQPDRFGVGSVGLDRQRLSARRFNRAHDFIGLVG